MFMCMRLSRTPTIWRSCRSHSSQAQPSRCSTAAPEPCTTLLLPTTTIIIFSTRRPPPHLPPSRWTPSAGQPAPPPCLPQWLPLLPPPPPPPASAGTSHRPDFQLRARLGPPSWHAAPCPSPARTWPAICVRSYVMQTSIRTQGLSTPCRSSPQREGAHQPAHLAPSAQQGWTGGVGEMGEEREGGRSHSGSGGLALRSCGRCMSELRPAISELRHTQTELI